MNNPLVSVVVTTKNSSSTISKCLESIKSQSYKSIEIVVVDNYSTDDTLTIAKKYSKNIYKKGPERSTQRNFGVLKSHGEFLLFLDSDMSLSKNVVEECILQFKKTGISSFYIPEKMIGKSHFSKIRNFERSFYNGTAIDAIRFVSKKDFISCGKFDERLIAGEDWDFDKRIRKKTKTAIISSPLYHDESGVTFKKYLFKKNYYATDLSKYIKKWGEHDEDIKKQFGFSYRFFGVFVENGKWKKLISHPLLFLEIIFVKIIVGVIFLFNKN